LKAHRSCGDGRRFRTRNWWSNRVLQMQRDVAGLRTRAGQAGPDDFVPLLTRFALALGGQVTRSAASSIATGACG
jgi:hypothetical protein